MRQHQELFIVPINEFWDLCNAHMPFRFAMQNCIHAEILADFQNNVCVAAKISPWKIRKIIKMSKFL